MRIGLIDWGIGGLDLCLRLRARAPRIPLLYLSDSGTPAYGLLCARTLRSRLARLKAECIRRQVTHVVLACNTLSSVLAQYRGALPMVGVTAPTLAVLERSRFTHIGVVGTDRTVRSGVYGACRAPNRRVSQKSVQPLGSIVEHGLSERLFEAKRLIAEAMSSLQDVDGLVLGCTHYVALAAEFHRHAPNAELVDPAALTAQWLAARWLPSRPQQRQTTAEFLTTGCPHRMREAASAAFGVNLGRIQTLPIHLQPTPSYAPGIELRP